MADLTSLRKIVLCLLRFDLWAADTITDDLNTLHRLENIDYHFQRMWRNLPPVELRTIDEWLRSPELYHRQPLAALREHVESFSESQLYSVVINSSARTFYTRLLFKRISKLVEQRAVNDFARQHPDRAFEELQGLLIEQRPANRREYLVIVAHRLHETQLRLRAVIREAEVFRDRIRQAQENRDLGSPALQVLREKLEALNEYYEDAYRELGEVVEQRLVNMQIAEFWNIGPQIPPPHATDAFPAHLPSLNFMLFNFVFLASIPAYFCFFSTPNGPGSRLDANFYQLLSSNVLQILSIVTLLWPTIFHTRLSRMAWFWSWLLAGISMICVVLSVVIYLVASVGWSSILSLFGAASISIVSLMLIFRI